MRPISIVIYIILCSGISTISAQNPSLQVDGYIRLSPSNPININSLPGIIHYDANEGVFKGFNGATWVNLSLSAHSDQYTCPDPNADMVVPEPKCITAMTVVLGKDGLTSIHAKEFDLGTTDNCGFYTTSFSASELVSSMSIDCNFLGTQQVHIYFKDLKNNLNYCQVQIVVQDNTSQCGDIN